MTAEEREIPGIPQDFNMYMKQVQEHGTCTNERRLRRTNRLIWQMA